MLRTIPTRNSNGNSNGFSMIEVLITIVVLAIGLLGLAALHTKMQVAGFESHQRAQAMILLADMTERLSSGRSSASSYARDATFGTGDTEPASCTNVASGAAKDLCEWSNALKGAAQVRGTAKTGAMLGARGCIRQVQAPDMALCRPGMYRVSVTWQGMHTISPPSLTCGQGLYGADDGYRRTIASDIVIGLPSCF